jgi:hypothetical protein
MTPIGSLYLGFDRSGLTPPKRQAQEGPANLKCYVPLPFKAQGKPRTRASGYVVVVFSMV